MSKAVKKRNECDGTGLGVIEGGKMTLQAELGRC